MFGRGGWNRVVGLLCEKHRTNKAQIVELSVGEDQWCHLETVAPQKQGARIDTEESISHTHVFL